MKAMFEFGYRKNNLVETTFEQSLSFIQSLKQLKCEIAFEDGKPIKSVML